jgi:hypothetical protein
MRSFILLLFAKYNKIDQVMEDEMGRACSMKSTKRNAYRILVGKLQRKETTRKTKT